MGSHQHRRTKIAEVGNGYEKRKASKSAYGSAKRHTLNRQEPDINAGIDAYKYEIRIANFYTDMLERNGEVADPYNYKIINSRNLIAPLILFM